jgi:hypothetical protein
MLESSVPVKFDRALACTFAKCCSQSKSEDFFSLEEALQLADETFSMKSPCATRDKLLVGIRDFLVSLYSTVSLVVLILFDLGSMTKSWRMWLKFQLEWRLCREMNFLM